MRAMAAQAAAPAWCRNSAATRRGQAAADCGRRRPARPRAHGREEARGAAAASALADRSEVLGAVQSLYADELKPYGRLLRKRIVERARAAGRSMRDVDAVHLRAACESCPGLEVEDVEGADWVALLTCPPPTRRTSGGGSPFVDIYSSEDVYPAELWQRAAEYFEGLDDEHMVLPGGRYSCGQVLVARGLSFLSGYSLGQVSHIVQLAISQKKVLGYLNGDVVPYGRSASRGKDQCAACQQAPEGSLVDWQQLRTCMKELMTCVPAGRWLALSNMKCLFRSHFDVELSETALGYAKLSGLLGDPRLSDVCTVKLQGHGVYVVTHPRGCGLPLLEPPGVILCGGPTAASPVHELGTLHITFDDVEPAPRLPLPPTDSKPVPTTYRIHNTFVHVDDDGPAAASPCDCGEEQPSLGRSKTAPARHFGPDGPGEEEPELEPARWELMYLVAAAPEGPRHGLEEECACGRAVPPPEAADMAAPAEGEAMPEVLSTLRFAVQNTFVHVLPLEPDTPSPWSCLARRSLTTTNARSAVEEVGFGM